MAFNALKHRDIAEINRMLKWLVGLVTEVAFAVGKVPEFDWVLERPVSRIVFRRARGIVDHRVADVAIIPDHLAAVADVFAVMAAETP